jgi:hypothetical protein
MLLISVTVFRRKILLSSSGCYAGSRVCCGGLGEKRNLSYLGKVEEILPSDSPMALNG